MIRLLFILIVFVISSNAIAADWYFDKDSKSISDGGVACNDSTGAGTKLSPFCNPYTKIYNYNWVGPAAGDTIYVRGGTYTGPAWRFIAGRFESGTSIAPITIKAYPGEIVTFQATSSTQDWIQNLSSGHNYLHFLGPFILDGYSEAMDDSWFSTPILGWRIENVEVKNGASGFYSRFHDGLIFKNINCHDLYGFVDRMDDHNICVGSDGTSTQIATNITFDTITCRDMNDGKGGPDGDTDCVWTDEYNDTVSIKNVTVSRMGEDGVDTKAKTVTMENIVSYNNGATGVKLWGGDRERGSVYNLSRIFTWGNSESGVKCSGLNDTVTAVIDHLTSWANFEDNIKNVRGEAGSNACNATWRNSIIGGSAGPEAYFADVYVDEKTNINHLSYLNMSHTNASVAINMGDCTPISGKYTLAQYANGTFNADMTIGVDCGGTHGDLSGSATNPTALDPKLTVAPETFVWRSIADSEIENDTVTLFTSADYGWPSPTIGHYVEINDDGVRRQITAIGDATTRTITFTPPVSSPVCGRRTDCRGIRVVGWGTDGTAVTTNAALQSISPMKDAGLFVTGVHCAQADDAGGTGLTGCVHWRGAAPDLGYTEYRPPGQRVKISGAGLLIPQSTH